MSDEPLADAEVGFCKPPKAHQFRKGHSGNPKGRKKNVETTDRSIADLVRMIMQEQISVTQNGRQVSVPIYEAAFRQVIAKILKTGDLAAFRVLLPFIEEGQKQAASRKENDWRKIDPADPHAAARAYKKFMLIR